MNIPFIEFNISELINYRMDMCWNGQGTAVVSSSAWHIPLPATPYKEIRRSP
jgi:hypothetical protein